VRLNLRRPCTRPRRRANDGVRERGLRHWRQTCTNRVQTALAASAQLVALRSWPTSQGAGSPRGACPSRPAPGYAAQLIARSSRLKHDCQSAVVAPVARCPRSRLVLRQPLLTAPQVFLHRSWSRTYRHTFSSDQRSAALRADLTLSYHLRAIARPYRRKTCIARAMNPQPDHFWIGRDRGNSYNLNDATC